MKIHIIVTLLLLILLSGCWSKKHLTFDEIPIDGRLDNFANELVRSGFTGIERVKENQVQLEGRFLEKPCVIDIYATRKFQTVYKVVVSLPEEIQDSVNIHFEKLQNIYTIQYGNARNVYKQFQNSSRFLFNERKLTKRLSIGDFSKYYTNSGYITLELRDGYIAIVYLDMLNYEIRKSELQPGSEYENDEDRMTGKSFM
jgi:hypothetical protein